MDTAAYLHRIGLDSVPENTPSYRSLAILQRQHLRTVPFENLDIIHGPEIVLDHDRLFEKIVTNNRGGFCYELNGLFERLLAALGFETTRVGCRVCNDAGELSPDTDHLSIIVELDRPYLVDVGFGDFARQPLPFTGEPQTDVSGTYCIQPDCSGTETFGAYRITDEADPSTGTTDDPAGACELQLAFSWEGRPFSAFTERCVYHQTSPESHFTDGPIATIATADGRRSVSDETVTITTENGVEKRPLESHDERVRLLDEWFGLDWDHPPETWFRPT
ncbi:MAG: arylamine N-acetyltransferase [Halobacteriales archaeon]